MKIKSLYIRDFGIFRDEKIDNLNDNIIVIGGFNRSGKSTFMQIIKHLGYGISKGENIPYANIKYGYNSDIVTEDGRKYNINIDGYKKPIVTPIDNNNNITIDEIYENVDSFTYNQLFTISLDELNCLKDSKNEKLQALLLGAGYKEIMCIPKIVNGLNKEADKLGKKQGRPNSGQFKQYNSVIKDMVIERNKALKQVDNYISMKKQLANETKEYNNYNLKLKCIEDEITVIDVLKNNYDGYSEKSALDEVIDEDLIKYNYTDNFISTINIYKQNYEEINLKYTKLLHRFKEIADEDIHKKDIFIDNKDKIVNLKIELPVIKEKFNNYQRGIEEYRNEMNNILMDISTFNSLWNNFQDIKAINIDNLAINTLNEKIQEYNNVSSLLKNYNERMHEYSLRIQLIKEKLSKDKAVTNKFDLRKYFYSSIIITALGLGISFINKISGIIISFAGFSGLMVYIIYVNGSNKDINNVKPLQEEYETVKNKYNLMADSIQNVMLKIKKIECYFDTLKKKLKLKSDVSVYTIKDCMSTVLNLNKDITRCEIEKNKLDNKKNEIESDICNINNFINNIDTVSVSTRDLHISIDQIVNKFEVILNKLEISQQFQNAADSKANYENKIRNFLNLSENEKNIKKILDNEIIKINKYKEFINKKNISLEIEKRLTQVLKTERVMKAFKIERPEEINYRIFNKYYDKYMSINDINDKYDQKCLEQKQYRDKINEINKNIENLRIRIENLQSSEVIETTERNINNARDALRPLAEKYAVYSTASFLLDKIQKKLIEDTRKFAFEDSSKILSYITDDYYKEILPSDNLDCIDFKSILKDGKSDNSTEIMSRGTKEQLFFAVRSGKINQLNDSLPIIFDDCLVNFDVKHAVNTIKVINELSKKHQIFILTCHPYIVQYIDQNINNAQYLKLENGKLNMSNSAELVKYLKEGIVCMM